MTNYICKSLVESVQFFQDADPYYVSSIIMKLELEVFMPNDDIVRIGTMGTKMYFIQHGVVDVMDENGKTFVTLDEGSHFGGQKTHRQSLHAISALQGPTVNLTSNSDSSGTPV